MRDNYGIVGELEIAAVAIGDVRRHGFNQEAVNVWQSCAIGFEATLIGSRLVLQW